MTDFTAAAKGRLAERLVPVAIEGSGLVRNQDAQAIGEWLAGIPAENRDALLIVALAMIPEDRTPQELLAWVTWDAGGRPLPPGAELVLWSPSRRPAQPSGQPVQPCGTIAAYQRHRNHGEEPCGECKQAKGDYTASRRAALRRAGRSAA